MVGLFAVLALAPWWRNHTHLRSFFDYGLAMAGAGRIEAGQKPYVDFITPAQAGWYFLNWASEKVGGGTFQAMTLGGAASILISYAVLLGMLARRWSLPAAAVMAGGLVCATVSQHTLWWYNPWGVICLTVVAWAGAVAPVLRREHLGWHLLALAGLFFGGINKINMQLMAVALALAWAVRAGLNGRASAGRVLLTVLFYLGALALPVLAEMAWTGASFATWWHNVITLPASSRSGMALEAFSPKYLLTPFNDHYYGLLLKPVGLIGLVLTVQTVGQILIHTWREAGWWERILPVVCGLVAYAGGVVLLATNMDIAYTGIGGWLALLVALWLGFGLPAQGRWFNAVMLASALGIGAVAWHSAWIGQRSQFGHSGSPRAAYVDAGSAGPDFGYFRGTFMPPETVESLRELGAWRAALPAERRAGHFYGPGTEWAAHLWPAMATPGLPISVYRQPGNSDGRAESARLAQLLGDGTIREITVSRVLDYWEQRQLPLLTHRFDKLPLGEIFSVYSANVADGVSGSPIWFTRVFGGNADSRQLVSAGRFAGKNEWNQFIAFGEGRGTMLLKAQSNRLQGEVVVRRADGAPPRAAAAEFAIYAQANPEARFERWRQRVELPAGEEEIRVPYAIDSSGMAAFFTVDVPDEAKGVILAGWRGPQLLHTFNAGPENPEWLYPGRTPGTPLDEPTLAKLLPGSWRPAKAFMRNGRVTDQGVELLPGGELWLKVEGFVTEFSGQALVEAWDPAHIPFVRGMWYRGGRLEVFTQMIARDGDRKADFKMWCAEPGGWLILSVDPLLKATPVRVLVYKATQG
ncbi:hypothetical protein ESB00_05125 [Oleiharenicola lentus]|uniref:Glycosyltransferase RgtA/B/C/D-like domain-containing protein n=1 Tax=Oleiharenicola lentus TaxID=2508720 RepID=A0A4Q1C8X4_9BACT|nr:hypothetical protein [Oleiharenicola lentus]RXK55282.1 hypothetical protein ESB00_05125 [Oleiharenicola lentus]